MLHLWRHSFIRVMMRCQDPWFTRPNVRRHTLSTDPQQREADGWFLPRMRSVTEWSNAALLAAPVQQQQPEQQCGWTMQDIMSHLLALTCTVLGTESWWLPTQEEDVTTHKE
jgi:hypothetical protein